MKEKKHTVESVSMTQVFVCDKCREEAECEICGECEEEEGFKCIDGGEFHLCSRCYDALCRMGLL